MPCGSPSPSTLRLRDSRVPRRDGAGTARRSARALLLIACALAPALANANGRPPATNGIHFKPGDAQGLYVATTFGLLVSSDGCRFYWLCEDSIGFGGGFDPAYAVTASGAILATTFHGLRVSRDGGCSFTSALPGMYLDAIDVGPGGEICVGSADTPADNGVFCSTDDAVTFAARGGLPAAMWYRSVKFAPGDANRIYASAFQLGGVASDAGERAPTAHLFRSDDDGMQWTEQPLVGVVVGSSPELDVMAVSPANGDIVFMRSRAANPPIGDRLFRSIDGGATFTEVLATTGAIASVVVRDARPVLVATAQGGSFRSVDGGATFQRLAIELGCVGQRSDGVLFGCTATASPGGMALARSDDGDLWHPVLRLQAITGPLRCPAGTLQHDACESVQWSSVSLQLGVTPASCASGPDVDAAVDSPRPDTTASGHRGGCCEAGDSSGALVMPGLLAIGWLAAPRSRRRRRVAVAGGSTRS
jgi:hypothetical protein